MPAPVSVHGSRPSSPVNHWRSTALGIGVVALIALAVFGWMSRDVLLAVGIAQLLPIAGAVLAAAALISAILMVFVFAPRIARPTDELSAIAERVAGGDLSVTIGQHSSAGEMGRLWRAIAAMVAELRKLAGALGQSSRETAALGSEITSGSEHMAAAAQEMAMTANELSRQSNDMAQSIQEMASDATRLVGIASELAAGAHEGVERNQQLRAIAQDNRTQLDESTRELEMLGTDVESSASAIEALGAASEEIRTFVTLVQKLARQSKLLALNAAMEAARAGEHGQGFAVVAAEVRRLAAGSSEAAEKTEAIVRQVLEKVDASRESSARAVDTVARVMAATRHGRGSFEQVEQGVQDTQDWTVMIESAAGSTRQLVSDMQMRMDELARGTESFAAAMQEVAASTEQQSASTEEIAAAANALQQASARLASLVSTFKLGDDAPSEPTPKRKITRELTPAQVADIA